MPEPTAEQNSSKTGIGHGFGRVLVGLYATFALAAGARSAVQLSTQFTAAPLAYLLSAFAALVYILATVALLRGGPVWRRVAIACLLVEATGVILVGLFTVIAPGDFPKATVWTRFGEGYGFVPLVLPFVGLWWLRRTPC